MPSSKCADWECIRKKFKMVRITELLSEVNVLTKSKALYIRFQMVFSSFLHRRKLFQSASNSWRMLKEKISLCSLSAVSKLGRLVKINISVFGHQIKLSPRATDGSALYRFWPKLIETLAPRFEVERAWARYWEPGPNFRYYRFLG